MTVKPMVLIVDDEPVNIQVLASTLKDMCEIKVATSGNRCIELAQALPLPDLILLDINMPGMDGYDVIRVLKETAATSNIPVVFVSSNDQDVDAAYGLALGASDYISKPIHPELTIARVKLQLRLKLQSDRLRELALHDQLTSLYNRHYLQEAGMQMVASAFRRKIPLSVVILDIDYFKRINDLYGHDTGDIVLRHIASILQNMCRNEDIVARYGGEEFVLLLKECNITEAVTKAESIRVAIESSPIKDINVTASFGVVTTGDHTEKLEDLIKRADQLLYRAKNEGRNLVQYAQ